MGFKVGDKVLVQSRWDKYIDTITKITPKGFIRTAKGKFYNSDGREKSSDIWGSSSIMILTNDMKNEFIKEKTIIQILKLMHDTKSLTYDKAIKIKDILES